MIPPNLKVHSVAIADYLGAGTYGERWATPRTVACWLERSTKLVVNAAGEQVVSGAQVFVDPGDEGPEKSKVTVSGVDRIVVAVANYDSGGISQLDHVELMLQ